MTGALKFFGFLAVLLCFLALPSVSAAQDLGSTSGLFKKKPVPKKRTSKKSNSKKKGSSNKKSSAKKRKSTKPRTSSAKATSKGRIPKRISITTAKKKSTTKPKSNLNSPKKTSAGTNIQLADNRKRKPVEDIVITVGEKTAGDSSEIFEDAIASGNAARNKRMYLDAEKAYSRAMSINPFDSRAIYGLGNIYSDQQRWEEAEGAYRKALAIEPENPLANIALSYVLTQPVVGSNLGERYAEADEKARKAIEKDSENAIGYDQLGVAMELRGIISQETEDAYRKAVKLDPTFALAYAHIGRLLRKQGRTNESSAAYRSSIKLAVDVPTMILVADVMQSQQRYLDSEQLLREALRRDPRNPTGLYLLGRALTTRKSFKEGEAVLKKSVEVSPRSFVSYALLGSLYSQSGDLVRAEQTLIRAVNVVSQNEQRRLALEFESVGDKLLKFKKHSDAARLYRRALALDENKQSLKLKLAGTEAKN